MFEGFGFLVGQIALLLVLIALLGVVLGALLARRFWPVRVRPDAAEVPTPAPVPVTATVAAAPPSPDHRAAAPLAPAPAPAQTPAAAEFEQERAELQARLREAQAEAARLRTAFTELGDAKETEMGRLETGAIQALETTIATHNARLESARRELEHAQSTVRNLIQDLDLERRRGDRLQAALADRDEHMSRLMADPATRPHTLPPHSGA
jgi:DNA repair exonuclease SbcCD ATPase subunit